MKKIFLLCALTIFSTLAFSQFTYKIKADSVLITNDSCNAELNLENSTRHVNGFLYNKGNGRTEFKKVLIKVSDSLYFIGGDSLKISSGQSAIPSLQQVTDVGNVTTNNISAAIFTGSADAMFNTVSIGKGGGTGANNLVVGMGAFPSNTTGATNTAIGRQTLFSNTSGSFNNAFGSQSLYYNTTGTENTAMGKTSLANNTTGNFNTGVGGSSAYNNTTGVSNTGVGYWSMFTNTTGNDNSAIGVTALRYNTSGSQNTAIGREALYFNSTGSLNVGIGYRAEPFDYTSNGQLSIQNIIYGTGNTGGFATVSTGNIGIGIRQPTQKLDVDGTVKATGFIMTTSPGAGKVLTSDAAGNASWQSAGGSGTGLSYPNSGNRYLNGYGAFPSLNTDSISEGSANKFYTDARARAAISLTTTGTSGAATYNAGTGMLNIPAYSAARFGIEDNIGMQNRLMALNNYNLDIIHGDSTYNLSAGRIHLANNDASFYVQDDGADNFSEIGATTSIAYINAFGGSNQVNFQITPTNAKIRKGGGLFKEIVTSVNGTLADASGNVNVSSGTVYTASNGLTKVIDDIRLGGILTANSTITTSSNFALNVLSTNPGIGFASSNIDGLGFYSNSVNNVGIAAQSQNERAGDFVRIPSSANSVVDVITVENVASGTPVPGIGAAIGFYSKTNGTGVVNFESNQLVSKWTNATNTTRSSQFEIFGVNNTVTARKLAVAGDGKVTLDGYGSGNFTGTPLYSLQTDGNGNIIEGSLSGGSNLSYPNSTNKYLNGYGAFNALNTDSISEGSTNKFYTDTKSRAAINLTTTGTSGIATYNSTTGIINVPDYITSIATATTVGTVKPGAGLAVDAAGVLSTTQALLTPASVPYVGSNGLLIEDNTGLAYDGNNLKVGHSGFNNTVGISINGGRGQLLASGFGLTIKTEGGQPMDASKSINFYNSVTKYARWYMAPDSSMQFEWNGHAYPDINLTYDLGTSLKKYRSFYGGRLNVDSIYIGETYFNPSAAGNGTVTGVSIVTANGVSGTVANASTIPAITLNLGAINPSSIIATGAISGSNLSGTNTGDEDLSGLLVKANNLSDLTSVSTARTNLGLGTLATQSGTFSGTSSGTNTGDQNLTGLLVKSNNLSDVTSVSTARTNLGLGTLATQSGTFSGTSSGTNTGDQNLTGLLVKANNLSDVTSVSTARANLGLGTLATQSGTFSGTSSGTNTGDQTITLTGNVTGSGTTSFATTIANGAVTDTKLRQSAALSVIGRSSNTAGNVADIIANTDKSVLVRNGTSMVFNLLDSTSVTALHSENYYNTKYLNQSSGTLIGMRVLTSGTSYVPSAGTKSISVQMMGGGGGGGGVTGGTNNIGAGGGGGSGSYIIKYITGISAGPYTFSIGSSGAGGAATGAQGSNGGNTTLTIGVTTYTAPGGSGGGGQTAGNSAAIILGGSGGLVGTNGDVNGAGVPGNTGLRLSGSAGSSGAGASSIFGGGGNALTTAAAGKTATGFGSGGGGGFSTANTARAGGAGSAGVIVIYEYR